MNARTKTATVGADNVACDAFVLTHDDENDDGGGGGEGGEGGAGASVPRGAGLSGTLALLLLFEVDAIIFIQKSRRRRRGNRQRRQRQRADHRRRGHHDQALFVQLCHTVVSCRAVTRASQYISLCSLSLSCARRCQLECT